MGFRKLPQTMEVNILGQSIEEFQKRQAVLIDSLEPGDLVDYLGSIFTVSEKPKCHMEISVCEQEGPIMPIGQFNQLKKVV